MVLLDIESASETLQDGAFSLINMDWIGFDLDHTLIQYKQHALLQLVTECFVEHLVSEEHYDRQLFVCRFHRSHRHIQLVCRLISISGLLVKEDSSIGLWATF